MRPIEVLAAEWVDARGDDGSIKQYLEPFLRKSLEDLLLSVRTEALTYEQSLKYQLAEAEQKLAVVTETSRVIAAAADRARAHERRQDELLRTALRERDDARKEIARLQTILGTPET